MGKIHHDIEFTVLRKKLGRTGSMDEKIALLGQLVSLNPRNPKNLALRKKYRDELENLRVKKRGKKKTPVSVYDSLHYKRLVTVVGETNSGKSTLINDLAGSRIEVSERPFTTWSPEAQMISCRDVPVMMVEIPAIYEGDNDESKYRFIKNSDIICICTKQPGEADMVVRCLKQNLILPADIRYDHADKTMKRSDAPKDVPAFVIAREARPTGGTLPVIERHDSKAVLGIIYELLNIQRIYSLNNGEIQDKPVVFPAGQIVTVREFIEELDKRMILRMKRVKVIHADTTVPDIQSAGPEYSLHDGDMVEIILK